MALVEEGGRRSATVAALEEAETWAVYQADFHRLRREYPAVNQALIAFLAGEVRRQNQLLLESLYVPAEKRVLRRLLELGETSADTGGLIPLTQEQLAEIAGTSRATVNRVLREEEQRGRWSCAVAKRWFSILPSWLAEVVNENNNQAYAKRSRGRLSPPSESTR